MEYKELVKSLSDAAWKYGNYGTENGGLLQEAADAIEDLLQKLSVYEERTKLRFVKNDDGTTEVLLETQWIPVTERLPEMNTSCLLYNKYYGAVVGTRIDEMRFRIPGSRFPDTPTHWMPLPTPEEEKR